MSKGGMNLLLGVAATGIAGFLFYRVGYTGGYRDATAQFKALQPLAQTNVALPASAAQMAGLPRFWRT